MNELEKRAKKHTKSLKNKRAKGWWINPDPGNPEAMNRFNNSTGDIPTNIGGTSGDAGASSGGCCESIGNEHLNNELISMGYKHNDKGNKLVKRVKDLVISVPISGYYTNGKWVAFIDYGVGEYSIRCYYDFLLDILKEFETGLCDNYLLYRAIQSYELRTDKGLNKNYLTEKNKEDIIYSIEQAKDRLGLESTFYDAGQIVDLVKENYNDIR